MSLHSLLPVTLFLGASLLMACGHPVPEEVTGRVIDSATGMPLERVVVSVFFTEWSLQIPGPEGTPKAKITERKTTGTGKDGAFRFDLRELKQYIAKEFPDEKLTMEKLWFKKEGYAELREPFTTPGQIFELTPLTQK